MTRANKRTRLAEWPPLLCVSLHNGCPNQGRPDRTHPSLLRCRHRCITRAYWVQRIRVIHRSNRNRRRHTWTICQIRARAEGWSVSSMKRIGIWTRKQASRQLTGTESTDLLNSPRATIGLRNRLTGQTSIKCNGGTFIPSNWDWWQGLVVTRSDCTSIPSLKGMISKICCATLPGYGPYNSTIYLIVLAWLVEHNRFIYLRITITSDT